MKFICCLILFCVSLNVCSQEDLDAQYSVDGTYFYGTLLRHNKNVTHLVVDHPTGIILGFNRKTFGEERWEREYNFPDWGVTFAYQDLNNDILGTDYGLYAHYNFYFLNRNLQLRIAQGIAYTTNPFDLDSNFKNVSYGSRLLSSTLFLLQYDKPEIIDRVGLKAGLAFVHHSNGNFRAPNSGTNVLALNLGLQYAVGNRIDRTRIQEVDTSYTEPIRYNFVLRGGVNESDFYNLGQHPFLVASAYADKRISYKNVLQFGLDFFYSTFLEKEIAYVSTAFPSSNLTGDEDFKRIGVFVGHEFRLGNIGLLSQFGYYVYYPYEYGMITYLRAGASYYIDENWFAAVTLKSHAASAEAIEFSIGYRL